jgi:hypothetical protein
LPQRHPDRDAAVAALALGVVVADEQAQRDVVEPLLCSFGMPGGVGYSHLIRAGSISPPCRLDAKR